MSTDAEDPDSNLSIRSLVAVNAHVPQVQRSRLRVTEEMEEMVQRGLTELVSDVSVLCLHASLC